MLFSLRTPGRFRLARFALLSSYFQLRVGPYGVEVQACTPYGIQFKAHDIQYSLKNLQKSPLFPMRSIWHSIVYMIPRVSCVFRFSTRVRREPISSTNHSEVPILRLRTRCCMLQKALNEVYLCTTDESMCSIDAIQHLETMCEYQWRFKHLLDMMHGWAKDTEPRTLNTSTRLTVDMRTQAEDHSCI